MGGTLGVSINFTLSDTGKFTVEKPAHAPVKTHITQHIRKSNLCANKHNMSCSLHAPPKCVTYAISKTEVITTKLLCGLFPCGGKQKWSLYFMPLFISGSMISDMLDGGNYIAPLTIYTCSTSSNEREGLELIELFIYGHDLGPKVLRTPHNTRRISSRVHYK